MGPDNPAYQTAIFTLSALENFIPVDCERMAALNAGAGMPTGNRARRQVSLCSSVLVMTTRVDNARMGVLSVGVQMTWDNPALLTGPSVD